MFQDLGILVNKQFLKLGVGGDEIEMPWPIVSANATEQKALWKLLILTHAGQKAETGFLPGNDYGQWVLMHSFLMKQCPFHLKATLHMCTDVQGSIVALHFP